MTDQTFVSRPSAASVPPQTGQSTVKFDSKLPQSTGGGATRRTSLRCSVHLQLVNPFLRSIERMEEKAMFHGPEPRGDKLALRRRILQLVAGVDRKDSFDDRQLLHKWTVKRHRRAAVKPFSQDEQFDEQAAAASSDSLLSSALMDEEEDETGARRSTLTGARAQKFYSTKDTAKCRWPPAYVTFRHDVAHRLDDIPSFASRRSDLLTLFQQRQELISALKQLDYIDAGDDNPSDDVIAHGFAALCHYVAECRDTARAAVVAKRKKLDRRTRDHVRDVVAAKARFERVRQQYSQAISDKEETIRELQRQRRTADRISRAMNAAASCVGCDVTALEKRRGLFRGTVSTDTHHWFARTAVFPAHCCRPLRYVKEAVRLVSRLSSIGRQGDLKQNQQSCSSQL